VIRNTSRDWPIEFVVAEYRPRHDEDQIRYGLGRPRYSERQHRHTLRAVPVRLRRRDRPADRIQSWGSSIPLHTV
jgi:hypothetical protein